MSLINQSKWNNIYSFINHRGILDSEYLEPKECKDAYHSTKILIIGAGGLGCEVLKDLALSGFTDIHVIDMDTVDISNLNRQFLFQLEDVGKNKSDVAAAFVNKRVKIAHVTSYLGDITKQPDDFYKQFSIVIGGLDAIKPRSWMNQTLQRFAKEGIVIPYIDGGSEGFQGQTRLIIPGQGSCYECGMRLLPPPITYPECTLASTPRLPEHCVEYCVHQFSSKEGRRPDGDKAEEVHAVYLAAKERADQFHITGVDEKFTLGVIKNVIPAVASTNSIIAAACVNEAVKLMLSLQQVHNYFLYSGKEGLFTDTHELEVNPECPVCGRMKLEYTLKKETTIQELITLLKTDDKLKTSIHPLRVFLKNPFLSTADDKILYNAGIPETHNVLPRPISDFIQNGGEFVGGDETLLVPIELKIRFVETEK